MTGHVSRILGEHYTRYTDSEWLLYLTGEPGETTRPWWDASFAR